jgi:hypothetical protein
MHVELQGLSLTMRLQRWDLADDVRAYGPPSDVQ